MVSSLQQIKEEQPIADGNTASDNHSVASTNNLSASFVPKIRKQYTIQRKREKWTKEEHEKFLKGIELHGRNWKAVEEMVQTKTRKQIRSHAQKHFEKLKKQGISFPAARAKKKALHPYPSKKTQEIFACMIAYHNQANSLSSSSLTEANLKEHNQYIDNETQMNAIKNSYTSKFVQQQQEEEKQRLLQQANIHQGAPIFSSLLSLQIPEDEKTRIDYVKLFSFLNNLLMPSIYQTSKKSSSQDDVASIEKLCQSLTESDKQNLKRLLNNLAAVLVYDQRRQAMEQQMPGLIFNPLAMTSSTDIDSAIKLTINEKVGSGNPTNSPRSMNAEQILPGSIQISFMDNPIQSSNIQNYQPALNLGTPEVKNLFLSSNGTSDSSSYIGAKGIPHNQVGFLTSKMNIPGVSGIPHSFDFNQPVGSTLGIQSTCSKPSVSPLPSNHDFSINSNSIFGGRSITPDIHSQTGVLMTPRTNKIINLSEGSLDAELFQESQFSANEDTFKSPGKLSNRSKTNGFLTEFSQISNDEKCMAFETF
jgi:SHAQKYF class myb-like DNA-binding protein